MQASKTPEPIFPLSQPPTCRKCGDTGMRATSRPVRRNNDGRKYYVCSGQHEGSGNFITFDDDIGIDAGNPTCQCGYTSRLARRRDGEGHFFSCPIGLCGWMCNGPLVAKRHSSSIAVETLPFTISDEPESAVPSEPKRSVLVSSHQDLELWLEESSSVNQNVSLERRGLVKRLFGASFKLLTSLLETARISGKVTSVQEQRCQNELERLFLWGDGFGATDGSLDDSLDKSTDLKMNVILLLSELGSIVSEKLFKAVNPSKSKVDNDPTNLRMLLETAEAVLQEDGHPRRNSNAFSDSDESECDFGEGVEDVASYIDCLMDLGPALEHPATDMESQKDVFGPETFQVSSVIAANYCRKIRDRFPSLDVKIVEKLGEANQRRSQRLQESFYDSEFVSTKTIEENDDVSEPLFSRSGGQHETETTKSTFVSDSIFSTDPIVAAGKEHDEAASQATLATFSTALSGLVHGIPRVPQLPESARSGILFACLACGKIQRNIRNRRAWRDHIFNDLQPYVCTSSSLGDSCLETTSSRSAWIMHETNHLRSDMVHIPCLFCPSTKDAMPRNTYFKHLAHHLREVSLAVLPQSHDPDSDSEGDSASSHMSDTPLLQVPGIETISLSPARSLESVRDVGVQPPQVTAIGATEESARPQEDSPIPPVIEVTIVQHPLVPLKPGSETETSSGKKNAADQGAAQENPKVPPLQKSKYKTGKTLGAGSYSVVKECVHIDTGRFYAAKVINKRLMAGQEHRIRNEIAVLKKVSSGHRNLLTLVDYFETVNNVYLITDLALGGELFDRICRKGSYYESDAAKIIQQVVSALAYLHDHGIVHRDLKPENLLFRTPEDHADLLIADFALSRVLNEEAGDGVLTSTCGTPGYMAPEIFKNAGHGKPVDIWALGVIVYFLLCGYTPFDRDSNLEEMQAILEADYSYTPVEYWKGVSQTARDFIDRCFAIEPKQRMTAHEAESHPFLQEGNTEDE